MRASSARRTASSPGSSARRTAELSTTAAAARPRSRAVALAGPGPALGLGLATGYLSLIVLLPLAALVWYSTQGGWDAFWDAVREPAAVAALKLTLSVSVVAALVNAVMGTVIAWVLVRDRFRGQAVVNALIDLPFALPTIVAGLTLLALYGPQGPAGIDVAFTRTAIVLAQ